MALHRQKIPFTIDLSDDATLTGVGVVIEVDAGWHPPLPPSGEQGRSTIVANESGLVQIESTVAEGLIGEVAADPSAQPSMAWPS